MLGKHYIVSQIELLEPVSNQQIPGLGTVGAIHADTLLLSWVCMIAILALASMAKSKLVADGPGGAMQGIAESLYNFVDGLAESQIGHKYKPYLPLIAGIFIFVLIANLIGIGPWAAFAHLPGWPTLPGSHEHFEIASPTTDINVTMGLALISLLVYLGAGFKAHGAGYLKLFMGPMAPIELMDMIIRPLTLALRLLLVITADELTRMVALTLLPFIAPTFVMAFEVFIAGIQAFVFALLSAIYIGLAVADHH